jgi:molybdopterin-binding protein
MSIEEGRFFSSVKLKVANAVFESIVSKSVVKEMELKEKDEVILLIKESDFLVVEVIGD